MPVGGQASRGLGAWAPLLWGGAHEAGEEGTGEVAGGGGVCWLWGDLGGKSLNTGWRAGAFLD